MQAKQIVNFGVPWEKTFGYVQAVKLGPDIYISGQLSHDDHGEMVAPASVGDDGKTLVPTNMGAQMRQAYVNAGRVLTELKAAPRNIVEEVIYVTDMDAAFAAGGPIRKAFYGCDQPQVACTLIVTPRLALPGQLVEIKFVARL